MDARGYGHTTPPASLWWSRRKGVVGGGRKRTEEQKCKPLDASTSISAPWNQCGTNQYRFSITPGSLFSLPSFCSVSPPPPIYFTPLIPVLSPLFNVYFLLLISRYFYFLLLLFLLLPALLSSPLSLPSLGVERPSVFQMKRWAVCVMWSTRWLLGCFMSQRSSYICSMGAIYSLSRGMKGWRFIGITGIYIEMNWCRSSYTDRFLRRRPDSLIKQHVRSIRAETNRCQTGFSHSTDNY